MVAPAATDGYRQWERSDADRTRATECSFASGPSALGRSPGGDRGPDTSPDTASTVVR